MKVKYYIKSLFLVFIASAAVTAKADHREGHVDVQVGELSQRAAYGQQVFNETCAACHGNNGAGTLKGPPLIHDIYNPGHHSNQAIISAIKNGVRQHHWPYGDMPAQEKIGFAKTMAVIEFIREVQVQNGVERRAHNM
ncbi:MULTISPECIES: cytochrome c [unclassified Marinobacterium]|uniref:c-type cytochrome n=1 Tax=unclassified Marinobacterium TaxID=2644139 RepID=UPI00156A4B2D|nr:MULTISPECIES: cytochrome c [unclassified Marinobacterium]NRP47788.1 Cytochrome c [Marinobacterium sp. xm-d-543]NRP94405.1 Cytochrome c [Marinobacterium sp. xm-g-59]NRQ24027.1 Cytochrome c [Marinobacterium sp. xm-m-312]